MASLSLRAYHRQIEEWIEQGLYDQVILHCRHILISYPKCLDTYRLLGKAFLESQKFGDANDIFQRILSSLPDDFVSHVGISIIREDESNLNEAIWHMERAFEIQPSNNAVQGELRRLYGRRDGIEPPKVNLNRSALARMYLKGSLHSQAIAEIRMALAEDPQRPDLEVLLAKAYFETQKISEAKEIANQLLAKLPYCYDAIYLLWRIALLEGKTKDAERYLAKLAELDPYSAFLNSKTSSVEFVPDTVVMLEKLDSSTTSAAHTVSQPDWAASLGVEIPTEKVQGEHPLPDWMTEQQMEAPFEVTIAEESQTEETPLDFGDASSESNISSEIPDWMRELGWEESEHEESQTEEISSVSPFSEEENLPELETGEIPDWLREISPGDEIDLPTVESTSIQAMPFLEENPPVEGDSIATWLAGLEIESIAPQDISGSEAEELPDWVLEMNNKSHLTAEILSSEETWEMPGSGKRIPEETPTTITKEPELSPSDILLGQDDLPDWLRKDESIPISEQLPEWLKSSTEEELSPFQSEPAITEEDTKPVKVQPTGVLSPEKPQSIEQSIPPMDDDEAFAWLEGLAAKQGAQEALLLSPEERKEEPPEWIREYLDAQPEDLTLEAGVTDTTPPEVSPIPFSEIIDRPITSSETTPPQSEETQGEELPDWLRTALEQEEPESISLAETEIEIPSWVTASTEEEWVQEFPSEAVTDAEEILTTESEVNLPDTLISTFDTTKVVGGLSTDIEFEEIESTEAPKLEQIEFNQKPISVEEEFEPTKISIKPEGKPISPEVELEFEAISTESEAEVAPVFTEEIPLPVLDEEFYQPETPLVEAARSALTKGLIDQAIGQYQALVKQRLDLDQIIHDLSQALYQYPMEVRMWMLLGDAYLRKDLLSEALDAYNKAEELLR